METIYDNISVKELREIMKKNKGKFKIVKVQFYDRWRSALYTKQWNRVDVQKRAGQYAISY